jgi:hypothetical protein
MNLLRGLRLVLDQQPAGAPQAPLPADGLPQINAFVEIAVNGDRRRRSVPVNAITPQRLITRGLPGLRPGDVADFLYTNDIGRFRFDTACVEAGPAEAAFALPAQIKTIESFANRRSAPRVPWLGPAQWRFAPQGEGYGTYLPASMMDVSSSGASIVVARSLREGAEVEVRFRLESERVVLAALSHVVRTTKLERSHKSVAGLRFVEIDPDAQRTLGEFVIEQQQARRERGVV